MARRHGLAQRVVLDLDSTDVPMPLLPIDLWQESPERTGPDYPNARSRGSQKEILVNTAVLRKLPVIHDIPIRSIQWGRRRKGA